MKEKTADRIRKSFMTLMEHHRYDDITISMITDRCHISRQAFYKYYMDKDDLCLRTSLYLSAHSFQMEEQFFWKDLILHMLQETKKYASYYRRVSLIDSRRMLFNQFYYYILYIYRNMICYRTKVFPENDLEMILQIYCRGGVQMYTEWVFAGMKESPEKVCELFDRSMPPEIHRLLIGEAFPKEISHLDGIQTIL